MVELQARASDSVSALVMRSGGEESMEQAPAVKRRGARHAQTIDLDDNTLSIDLRRKYFDLRRELASINCEVCFALPFLCLCLFLFFSCLSSSRSSTAFGYIKEREKKGIYLNE